MQQVRVGVAASRGLLPPVSKLRIRIISGPPALGALPGPSTGDTASSSSHLSCFRVSTFVLVAPPFPGVLSPSFPSPLSNGPSEGIYAVTRSSIQITVRHECLVKRKTEHARDI
jgi:hypothetical protein